MATHRLLVPAPSGPRLLAPSQIAKLRRPIRLGLLIDFLLISQVPAVLLLFSSLDWWLALLWSVSGTVGTAYRAVLEGRKRLADEELDARNADIVEHLAREPGGAPLVADVTGHCGCTHRYAYDRHQVAWIPMGLLDRSVSCPVTTR